MTGTPVASFEVSIAPDVWLVASVRRFVGELCARTVVSADAASRVLVAVHELLDNAVRHGAGETCAIRFEIERRDIDVGVLVVTKNRANVERRRELARLLEEMRASLDPAASYQAILERVARGADGAGLGLGRVSAEAGFRLSGQIDEDEVVVRAEGRFSLGVR